MFSTILLLVVLAVAGVEISAEALFPDADFALRIDANSTLRKRFDGARFTFFDTGLGACGTVNSASDFVRVILIIDW